MRFLALLCYVLLGLSAGSAIAQEPAPEAPASEKTAAFPLELVPTKCPAAVMMRPNVILTQPELAPLAPLLAQASAASGLAAEDFELAAFVAVEAPEQFRGEPGGVFILRARKPHDWAASARQISAQQLKPHQRGDGAAAPELPMSLSRYFLIDDRTIIVGDAKVLDQYLDDIDNRSGDPAWAAKLEQLGNAQVIAAIDTRWVERVVRQAPRFDAEFQLFAGAIGPLWKETQWMVGGLDVVGPVRFRLLAQASNEQNAEDVADTLRAIGILAANQYHNFKPFLEQQLEASADENAKQVLRGIFRIADQFVDNAKVSQRAAEVQVEINTELTAADFVKLAPPFFEAVRAVRERAKEVVSVNNMRQLALAMHLHADIEKDQFPPAVLVHPETKQKYSWRVAMLPYLEQQDLYDAYRFDEPWDSPANKRLLAQMPDVFRHVDSKSVGKTCYLVPSGPGCLFDGTKQPPMLADVSAADGLSRTIMIAEAAEEVPWTQPVDLVIDPKKPLPKLGFGPAGSAAQVSLADGRILRLPELTVDQLRSLFTFNGKEPFPEPGDLAP